MKRMLALLVVLFSLGVLSTACGGGGGGGGGSDGPAEALFTVTGFDPGIVYGEEPTEFVIEGEGFLSLTGKATVRFVALSGSPFQRGTRDSLEVEVDIVSITELRGSLKPQHVTVSTAATVTVTLANTGEVTLDTPVAFEPQGITDFTPTHVDGSREVAFTIKGSNFRPVGSDASITFLANGTGRFYRGGNPDGSQSLGATGTIISASEIQGVTPYAGVVADSPSAVSVTLPTGAHLSAPSPVTFGSGTTGVRGTWTYEAPDSTLNGLDYADTDERPVRRACVQLVNDALGTVITTRVLGEDGSYEIQYGMDDDVHVRVLAKTSSPAAPIQVRDNTNGGAIWASEGPTIRIRSTWEEENYSVPLGWSGSAYTAARASGPFSILDAVYEATTDVLAVRSPTFPLCVLNWSPDNRPETGAVSDGAIGTSYYDPTANQLYLLGQEDVDTDEYDTHVVIHEWGHFFEANLSRTDSFGGGHYEGDRLDPTVAFGEGCCNALSALVLAPDTTYTDSYDPGQAKAFGFDLENNASDTNSPGWFSESSIQWLVYDLFDDAEESWDSVSLGLGTLYDVLTGAMKDTASLTTIFAFIDGLKDISSNSSLAIDKLCQHHDINATSDEWGTGESNSGGWSANLPVYHKTPVGTTSYVVTLNGGYAWNQLESVRLLYFQGTGGFVTVDATTPQPSQYLNDHDIDIEVYESGVSKGYADEVWFLTESLRFLTKESSTYVVRINDLGSKPGTYTCTVSVKNQ